MEDHGMHEGFAFPVRHDDGGHEECATSRPGRGKVHFAVLALVYASLGFLLYSGVIINGPFLFDDYEYIIDNSIIRNLSYFTNMNDPRHLGYFSFAINYAIGGENPFGFHLFNIIVHIVNAVLVFLLIKLIQDIAGQDSIRPPESGRRQRRFAIAFITGIIFLVHPIETQAVSYITQRFTSLSAMFYLFSVFFYLSARSMLEKAGGNHTRGYIVYFLSFLNVIFAMKTKEIAFTIPFTIAVFEYLLFRDSIYGKRRFIYLIPIAATLIIIPVSLFGPELGLSARGMGIDEVTRRDKLYDLYERSPYEYLATQMRVIVTYIRLLIMPVRQLAVYDYDASHSLLEPRVIKSFVLLSSLFALAPYFLWRARRAKTEDSGDYLLIALGILWFFITISIESSFIPIKDLIFEHRVYLPSIGFFAACTVVLMRIAGRAWKRGSGLLHAVVLVSLVACPLSVATYVRNDIWTDEVRFWDDIVQKTGKAIGYNNRGNAYSKRGQHELALRDMDKTISFFPGANDQTAWENSDFTPANMVKTYISRGQIYMQLGKVDMANADFEKARQIVLLSKQGKGSPVTIETAPEAPAKRRVL